MSKWLTSALVVYAEPLIVGKRVLVIAPLAESEAERLVALGARSVHVFEPTPSGDQLRSRVVVMPLPTGDFDVRDGAFDLAIVPDLDDLPDAQVWLARLRRVLGVEGALLVATQHVEQEAYYRLYDTVALQFASVVMHAEVPFSGVAIAELGRTDDVEVSVDTQLMDEPRSPLAFVALASQSSVHLAPYAIVEAPEAEQDSSQATPSEQPMELATARLQVDLQSTQLDEERAARQHVEHELHRITDLLAAEKSARATAERAAELAMDARVLHERVAVLETSLQLAEESVELTRARLNRTEESLQKKAEEALVLLAEIDAVRSLPPPSLPPPGDDLRVAELEAELSQLEEIHAAEVDAFEQQLQARAATIATQEHEARARERVARELVAQLEEADTGLRPLADESATRLEELKKKLDAAALEAARRQSELEARAWRIEELETFLGQQIAPTSGPALGLDSEVDALRQALAQEHAARIVAESGEALLEARRELERQSALLHQLQQQRR